MKQGTMRGARWLLGGLLLLASTAALAQFVWLDDKGLRQYSDRPPPVSVPLKRILKAPNLAQQIKQQEELEAAAAPETAKAPSASAALAARNADFLKRREEQAEKDKKAGQEAAIKADAASRCEDLRKSKILDESGGRIATVNKNGERDIMNDEERVQRRKKILASLEKCN